MILKFEIPVIDQIFADANKICDQLQWNLMIL